MLAEDRVDEDVTSKALFPRPVAAKARIIAQRSGVVSGISVAVALARRRRVIARPVRADGASVRPGTAVLELDGDLRDILGVERTILNVLMHLSGVATTTRRAVERAGPLAVYATRKTLPGLRDLEKAAVVHGGGHSHRRDLASAVLIKSPHLERVPIDEAVARGREGAGGTPVQVEVRTLPAALAAARAGADALLLDNLSPSAARRIVQGLARSGLRRGRWIELSGGITPGNVGRYRRVGADAVSLGALTHSAPALPFHLRLAPARLPRRGAPR